MRHARSNTLALWVGVAAAASSSVVRAEEPQAESINTTTRETEGQVHDIVVTAQRRSQRMQDVPIAVTALTSNEISSAGIDATTGLSIKVPALTVTRVGNAGVVFLRGAGTSLGNPNDEPSVALYVDGVYMASPQTNMFSFNNIERIEVLKGPQGTLFGRNATGGVVQIVTADPSHEPTGRFEFGYGRFDTVSGAAYLSGGLSKNLAADIALVGENQADGWGTNLVTGEEVNKQKFWAVRSKWLWAPDALTEVRFAGDYSYTRDTGMNARKPQGAIGADGLPAFPGFFNTQSNWIDASRVRQGGVSLTVERDVDFATLKSISAFRKMRGTQLLDQDMTPLPIVDVTLETGSRSLSQELQIFSPSGSSFDWLAGAYFISYDASYRPATIAGFAAAPFTALDIYGKQFTRSLAIFGQVSVPLTPELSVTGGIRYTHDWQKHVGRIEADGIVISPEQESRQDQGRVTGRVSLDYKVTPDILLFASFNRGVKSGGYNLLEVGRPGYRPETLDAYEIGFKSDLFGRIVRFNGSIFQYDYDDLQFLVPRLGVSGVQNAATARIRGFDSEITIVPSRFLTLSGGMSYLDGSYRDFPDAPFVPGNPSPATIASAAGKRTINTPKWTANAGYVLKVDTSFGSISLGSNIYYNSGFFWTPDNRLAQPSHFLLNSQIGWQNVSKTFGITFWGKNLTDERYLRSGNEQEGLGDLVAPAAPRTYGVTLKMSF